MYAEEWLSKLFGICKCKCNLTLEYQIGIHRGKLFCSCEFEDRIPAIELDFLFDQRNQRKMIIGWSKDNVFAKRSAEKVRRLKIKGNTSSASGLERQS